MLEVFRELEIVGNKDSLTKFIDWATSNASGRWSRFKDGESRTAALSLSPEETWYAFIRSESPGIPAAALFMILDNDRMRVTNIVPEDVPEISRTQYNAILSEFISTFVEQGAAQSGNTFSATQDRQHINHWLSDEAVQRLNSFSRLANKSTGASHPNDSERWNAFLIKAHQERTSLDADTLQRWLIEEENWSEEKAFELSLEYEFARDLLRDYDEVVV